MAWVKPTASGITLGYVAGYDVKGEDQGQQFWLAVHKGIPRIMVGNFDVLSSVELVADKWQHLATTYDGTRLRFYVDGALTGHATVKLDTAAQAFAIGKNPWALGQAKNAVGPIEDIVLFDRALSPAEIHTYVASKAVYGSTAVSGAQADFDDVIVTQTPAGGGKAHHIHQQLLGIAPHSDSPSALVNTLAHWRLDGATEEGTLAVLPSGATGTGILATRGRFGDYGGAVWFNGEDASVTFDESKSWSLPAGTLELWVRMDQCTGAAQYIVSKNGAGGDNSIDVVLAADCELQVQRDGGATSNWVVKLGQAGDRPLAARGGHLGHQHVAHVRRRDARE